ncbi:hypothetical protein ACFOW3_24485 [Acidovorax facilis]|uniref:DUF2909 domain-containing protein n=1 Tax=Acidovorax facilis TaxID=12917 RepID=A0ABV8DHJ8_9BURK|nr:hypothetical protein AE621_24640 [Acidovorax sp. SD340]
MGITTAFLLGMLGVLLLVGITAWGGRSEHKPNGSRQRGQVSPRVLISALSLSAAGLVGLVVHENCKRPAEAS